MRNQQEAEAMAAHSEQVQALLREDTLTLRKHNERVALRNASLSAACTVWMTTTAVVGGLDGHAPWWGTAAATLTAGLFAARTVRDLWRAITITLRSSS